MVRLLLLSCYCYGPYTRESFRLIYAEKYNIILRNGVPSLYYKKKIPPKIFMIPNPFLINVYEYNVYKHERPVHDYIYMLISYPEMFHHSNLGLTYHCGCTWRSHVGFYLNVGAKETMHLK